MNGYLLGRLLVTTMHQGTGAPFIDQAFSRCEAAPGVSFGGWAILLRPWRRNRYGERGGLALVIGWRGLNPATWRLRRRRPTGPSTEVCLEECSYSEAPKP